MSMIVSICLLIASMVAALAAWRMDRIKDGHNPRVLSSIRMRWGASIAVVCLALTNQYFTYEQTVEQRATQFRISVLQNLANYRDDLFMSYSILLKNAEATNSFINFEGARSSSPGAALAISPWEEHVSESWRHDLSDSKAAFEKLQKIAREILFQATTYPDIVPEALVSWATETLSLQFKDVPKITNDASPEAQQYGFRLGQGVGVITGQLRSEAMKVSK